MAADGTVFLLDAKSDPQEIKSVASERLFLVPRLRNSPAPKIQMQAQCSDDSARFASDRGALRDLFLKTADGQRLLAAAVSDSYTGCVMALCGLEREHKSLEGSDCEVEGWDALSGKYAVCVHAAAAAASATRPVPATRLKVDPFLIFL